MKTRIVTGLIIFVLFMVPFTVGNHWFSIFSLILASIAYYEYSSIIKVKAFSLLGLIGFLGILFLFSPFILETEDMQIKIVLALVIVFLIGTIFKEGFSIEKAGTLIIGLLYIGFGFYSIANARLENGFLWTFTVLLSIWATDSGAYFIGKKFGKRKLAERISPNKTIEGSLGGICVSFVVVIFMQFFMNSYDNFFEAIMITLLASILGQLGDLIESAIKRSYSVKDSGRILPGHGGILDRLDSWLLVFICFELFGILQ